MAAIAAVQNITYENKTIPFIDKNFKSVRALLNSCYHFSLATVYKVMSIAVWAFNSKLCNYFNDYSKYHLLSSMCLGIYNEYNNEIIEFAKNWIPPEWNKPHTKLEGYCLGNSYDFISNYLEKKRSGLDCLNAVKAIASRYIEVPKMAQTEHILYHQLIDDVKHEADKFFNEQKNELEKLQMDSFERQDTPIAIIEETNNKIENMKRECLDFKDKAIKKVNTQIENHFNLNLVKKPEFIKGKLLNMENGVYEMTIENDHKKNPHAIAFIKDQDHCFIYDSNIAILHVDPKNVETRLEKIANLYLKNKPGKITLNQYTLKS